MNHHVVIKLRKPLRDGLRVPAWVDFISDKSVVIERVDPDVDRVMDRAKLKFWLTREYKPAGKDWDADEVLHGLDRTYRLIVQDDSVVPDDLVQQLKRLPSVQD